MGLAIVIPESEDIQNLISVLQDIRDTDKQRLLIETKIFNLLRYDHLAVGFQFTQQSISSQPGFPGISDNTKKENIMSLQLTDTQQATLTIQPVDKRGNPAPVDGAPTWSVSDPATLSITPAADGMSAVVAAVGPLTAAGSSVQVNVSADADLGTGVTTITGTLDVTVVSSQATALNIATGAPTEQP